MTRLALAATAAMMLPVSCTPAYADSRPTAASESPPPACAPLRVHADYLGRRWDERPVAPGRVGRATVLLFLNPRTGSWTLVRIVTPETGCAVGAGGWPAHRRPRRAGSAATDRQPPRSF